MKTFLLGMCIFVVGAFFYGNLCEKFFGPDEHKIQNSRQRTLTAVL